MTIKPPKWANQCVPTTKGWQDPKTGEILVSGSISAGDIEAWHEAAAPAPKAKPKILREAPVTEDEVTEELFEDIEDDEE